MLAITASAAGAPLPCLQRHAPRLMQASFDARPCVLLAMWGVQRLWQPRRDFTRARAQRRRLLMAASASTAEHRSMKDWDILDSLRRSHGWTNRDMGAGGDCLFLSMAAQVNSSDVEMLPSRSEKWGLALGADLGGQWEAGSLREKANLLRRIAMLEEAEFFEQLSKLRSSGEPLPADVEFRTREFYTDMAEEFISTNTTELACNIPGWDLSSIYKKVRELNSTQSLEQKCEFVLRHAEQYMETTGRVGNWAGSSEMAALGYALQRPVQAYGNNNVSDADVLLLESQSGSWEVQPYFQAEAPEAKGDPIRVFQTGGGGHYQMLA